MPKEAPRDLARFRQTASDQVNAGGASFLALIRCSPPQACEGSPCSGKDPAASGCASHASTNETQSYGTLPDGQQAYLYNRWSGACEANWTLVRVRGNWNEHPPPTWLITVATAAPESTNASRQVMTSSIGQTPPTNSGRTCWTDRVARTAPVRTIIPTGLTGTFITPTATDRDR